MNLKSNSIFNCDALTLFERIEDNTFNLVYLDPPWGYNESDKKSDEFDYEEYLFKVIQQAYRVLKSTGHLFFHSMPNAKINFQSLIEPVFERENLRSQFILPIKLNFKSDAQIGHDYNTILLYSKSFDSPLYRVTKEVSKEQILQKYPFEDGLRYFRTESIFTPMTTSKFDYDWEGFRPPSGHGWRFNHAKLNELKNLNKIYFSANNDNPSLKRYFDEDGLPSIGGIWDDIPLIDKKQSKKWTGTQSLELFERILKLGSKEEDWILDPFSGAGPCLIKAGHLRRRWLGNDSASEAIELCKTELEKSGVPFNSKEIETESEIVWDNYLPFRETKEELLKKEIGKGENQRLEFKESIKWNYRRQHNEKDLVHKIIKEIAGFMNSKYGGKLILGVQDDGKIIDINKDFEAVNPQKKDEDGYCLFISSNVKNVLGAEKADLLNIEFLTIEGNTVCCIKVAPSTNPVFVNEEFYVRIITETTILNTKKAYEFIKENKVIS